MGGERFHYGRRADRDHARSSSARVLYGLSNSKSLISFFRYSRRRLMIFSSNWRARSREMLYFLPMSSSVIGVSERIRLRRISAYRSSSVAANSAIFRRNSSRSTSSAKLSSAVVYWEGTTAYKYSY